MRQKSMPGEKMDYERAKNSATIETSQNLHANPSTIGGATTPRNMDTKAKIIQKLRDAAVPFPDVQSVKEHFPVAPVEETDPFNLTERFIQAAEKLSCVVYKPQCNDYTVRILSKIIAPDRRGSTWDWDQIPFCGLEQVLEKMDVQIAAPDDPSVRVGITGAAAALAANGSIFCRH